MYPYITCNSFIFWYSLIGEFIDLLFVGILRRTGVNFEPDASTFFLGLLAELEESEKPIINFFLSEIIKEVSIILNPLYPLYEEVGIYISHVEMSHGSHPFRKKLMLYSSCVLVE